MDSHGVQRLPLRREGWNYWDWEGRKIHYITAGQYEAAHESTRSFVYVSSCLTCIIMLQCCPLDRPLLRPISRSTQSMPYLCSAGDEGTPLLLIHGFGASAYHWRYNINELAKTHRVFAIDLLGFGWSDKPLVEYSKYDLWPRQLSMFINEASSPISDWTA